MKNSLTIIALILVLGWTNGIMAQNESSVNWMTFEELDALLALAPKKVFIAFHTDWCTYCHKMDREVFTNPLIIDALNKHYYAVRFDAESKNEVQFSGQTLINDQLGKNRKPVHQIAQILALRNGEFVAPTIVLLNENFEVVDRHFKYMSSNQLLKALRTDL